MSRQSKSTLDLSGASRVLLDQSNDLQDAFLDSLSEPLSQVNSKDKQDENVSKPKRKAKPKKPTRNYVLKKQFNSCESCGKVFVRKELLRVHKVKEHGERGKFSCDQCPKSFYRKQDFTNHSIKQHSSARRFECDFENCSKDFRYRTSMLQHQREFHSEVSVRLQCQLCNQTLSTKRALNAHMKTVHESGLAYECGLCDKVFYRKNLCENHKLRIHSDARPYACNFEGCSSHFKTKTDLTRHVRKIHSSSEA